MTFQSFARACGLVGYAFLLLGVMSLRADDSSTGPASSASVSTPITDPTQVRHHYLELLTRPQFQETEEPAVNSRLEDWLSQWFKQIGARIGEFKYSNRMPAFESLLMTLLVVLSISVLLYIMVRLTRRRGFMDDESLEEFSDHKAFRPPEFYDQEIQHAIESGDWHTAWLAAWRQFLSRLEHRHLVDADRTRTNREYLAQLRGKSLGPSTVELLDSMVDTYDRRIYGRESIAEPDWKVFHQKIQEATLLLHLDDKIAPNAQGTS